MKAINDIMKSYSHTFLLALVCIIGFTACSQPDENEEQSGNEDIEGGIGVPSMSASFFVGTWYPTTVLGESEFYRQQGNYTHADELLEKSERISFKSNGTGNYKWNNTYSDNSDFTWRIKGDKIVLLWNGSSVEEFYDVSGYNSSYVTFVYKEGDATSWFADNRTLWEKK